VDRAHFHPPNEARVQGKRRLLYYARPGNPRNMLGLGLEALRAAVGQTVFQHDNWEFLAIGGSNSLPPISLGHGAVLQLANAIEAAAVGRRYLGSNVAELAVQSFTQDDAEDPIGSLSPRERQTISMVVQGLSSTEIGKQLHLSPKTVATYRSRLMAKLGVGDVPALVRLAIRHKLIEPDGY
jgi:DNA-binding CsgD family transcriptional regulator